MCSNVLLLDILLSAILCYINMYHLTLFIINLILYVYNFI